MRSEIRNGSMVLGQPLEAKPDEGKPRVRRIDGSSYYSFTCPGCGGEHTFNAGAGSPHWDFNGSLSLPTFHPSMRVRSSDVCHFFVTDGQIQFVGDSTHALSGKTVMLPELEDANG